MRNWAFILIGVVSLLIGGVWGLQGAGVLTGSPMTGQSSWLVIGIVLVVLGVLLLFGGIRGRLKDSVR